MTNHARYIAIVEWAKARYQAKDGSIVVSTGGVPSRYSCIEDMAWRRYIQSLHRDSDGCLVFRPD